jgi:nitronate monooxygenase
MSPFARLDLRHPSGALLLQGFQLPGGDAFTAAMARAGGLGVLRLPAFPDAEEIRARLRALRAEGGWIGLDVKGLLGEAERVLEVAKEEGVSFLLHGASLKAELRKRLSTCTIPRLVLTRSWEEAKAAEGEGASGLVMQGEPGSGRLAEWRTRVGLPLLASVENSLQEAKAYLAQGVAGLQLRSPACFRGDGLGSFTARLRERLGALGDRLEQDQAPLPPLRIRDLELTYPIIQGGMGVGVSWEGLAGAVASAGCGGVVSAIGTGYRYGTVDMIQGRPKDPTQLNHAPSLARILGEARERSGGRGAVGVNVLCAIQDYGRVVHEAAESGAQFVISGAGLPLSLPEQVGREDVALIPIISSARALGLLCKQWRRKYDRLPDAVVLEGPLSGGHQGFSLEQCADPTFSLEALLPSVLEERDRWGTFPVIVAGGIWDQEDIRRFLTLGASGVQMGTRFIGTFECDASEAFKSVILKATDADIGFMKSPVGMPARGVFTALQRAIEAGTAPKVKCISNCLQPCGKGEGAKTAGYCIADRLSDAWKGDLETGLFFSGSNGGRLKDLVTVRELVEELTGDWGLQRLAES